MASPQTEPETRAEFVRLLTEHQPRLTVFVRSLVGDATAARDVLQDTNLTLWRKADDFTPGTNFWAWASRVAYFEVRAFRTRVGRDKCVFSDELLQQMAPLAEQHSGQDDLRQTALQACLKKLSPRDSELIRKRYYGDQSLADLATAVRRSVEATRKLLARARRSLLSCIEKAIAMEGQR